LLTTSQELQLIEEALIDPQDQSLWFYHQFLASAFHPSTASWSVVPGLTIEERLNYINVEILKILDMLVGAEDCKWIYLALVQLSSLYYDQKRSWPTSTDAAQVSAWVQQIKQLDPLRMARWNDWAASLQIE